MGIAALELSNTYIHQVILKVAGRCNLNCSYCYMYNKADSTWRRRPPLMSNEVFEAALERIYRHCQLTGQNRVHLAFHGGEPCLIGIKQFDTWCKRARQVLSEVAEVSLGI